MASGHEASPTPQATESTPVASTVSPSATSNSNPSTPEHTPNLPTINNGTGSISRIFRDAVNSAHRKLFAQATEPNLTAQEQNKNRIKAMITEPGREKPDNV
ncbi:hypothetical protein BGZ52_009997 [Haplosporangium bisporale]|nr:hypothetical protein BGZ52_009997 [Haplosporangium bisporale]KAF9211063.1 hypothetical protein BGZ59_008567 [Podila verticillata]